MSNHRMTAEEEARARELAPELAIALKLLITEATAKGSTSSAFNAALIHAAELIRKVETP